jgi:hypothetical protein
MLLGDLPIKYFLANVVDIKTQKTSLKDFGTTSRTYGKYHTFRIEGIDYEVLPLVHPRQVKGLGRHSKLWFDLHAHWITKK